MKKIALILLLTFVFYSSEVYAVMDVMAKVETTLGKIEKVKNQVLAEAKQYMDAAMKVSQGFNSLKNCFANPISCGQAFTDIAKAVDGVSAIGEKLKKGDLSDKSPKELAESVREDGTFKEGQEKSIEERNKFEKINNAVVTTNIARLFAKGIVTRQSILLEKDEELYEPKFEKNDLDEILYAQNKITLNSKRRIAHILELRAYMHSAEALKELTQYNRAAGEE